MSCVKDERTALYLLAADGELPGSLIQRLYDLAGSYREILETDPAAFVRAGVLREGKKPEALRRIRATREEILERYGKIISRGIWIITHLDPDYPTRLKNIPDPPLVLYLRGHFPGDDTPTAGVIGARECSAYGRDTASFFSEELAKKGIGIVSGMAYGIDSAAGEAAVKGGGESFAVLGCGVNICYPRESYPLYEAMWEGNGGVISEYPPDTAPLGFHFAERNRIIAGLSDVLLVIEARERSGTSITVGHALDQGKDVFALPGRITDPLGRGCNRLLKEGAIPLTSPADVLEYFGMEADGQMTLQRKSPEGLKAPEKKLLHILGEDTLHIEDLSFAAGFSLKDTITLLAGLEQRGYVQNTMSAYYKRL